jgi:hypothetical protein
MDTKFFEKLDAAKADMNIVTDGDYKQRMLNDVQRVRGQENYAALIGEYKEFVKNSTAAILLTGEGQGAFARKAEEEGGTLSINASDAYHDLLKGLWDSMGGTGRFSLDQMVALHARLEKFAKKNGVEIFRMPTFDKTINTFHPDKASFLACLREEMVATLGTFVVTIGVQNQLFTAAVAARLTNYPIPATIINAIESEQAPLSKMLGGRVVVADASEDVVEVFKQLLSKLKTKE